jgi:diketogulonate reductase-like aldo/keto reductase
MLYGTAWKEDATAGHVEAALAAGFRGIDTANQRRHYHEAGVGAAIAAAGVDRDGLFLQTKFTFRRGQDHRLPYDPDAPIGEQVRQSFASSLEHLGVERIDSLILHGPTQRRGLGEADRQAWSAMEALVDDGRVGALGVSNVSAEQLRGFCDLATAPPSFCQNRCSSSHGSDGWDREVRAVCAERGVRYQGFSLLTANRPVVADPRVAEIGRRRGLTPAAAIFRFALDLGMLPLTGTTDPTHMRDDLAAVDAAPLDAAERALIEGIA